MFCYEKYVIILFLYSLFFILWKYFSKYLLWIFFVLLYIQHIIVLFLLSNFIHSDAYILHPPVSCNAKCLQQMSSVLIISTVIAIYETYRNASVLKLTHDTKLTKMNVVFDVILFLYFYLPTSAQREGDRYSKLNALLDNLSNFQFDITLFRYNKRVENKCNYYLRILAWSSCRLGILV